MGFDYNKLRALQEMLSKEAQFVPPDAMAGGGMPPGGDPAMMAGGMPQMDPAAMGADPSMAGGGMPPMDPAAMGADPSMAGGGMPPIDPAMLGMDPSGAAPPDAGAAPGPGDVSPTGEPYMKITPTQLSKLFKQFAEVFKSVLGIGGQTADQAPQPQAPSQDPALIQKMTELNAKIDAVLGLGA